MAGRVTTAGLVAGARTRIAARTWQDAVHAAAHLLVEAGAADEVYEERCVELLREHGPYIVIVPGLAVVHARPEDGARRLALGAVTLRTPVRFGHPANDPVDVVLAFASPDREMHCALLARLARRLAAGLGEATRAARSDAALAALLEEVIDDDR
jgi:PTS system ascorbate-specific IIA component